MCLGSLLIQLFSSVGQQVQCFDLPVACRQCIALCTSGLLCFVVAPGGCRAFLLHQDPVSLSLVHVRLLSVIIGVAPGACVSISSA